MSPMEKKGEIITITRSFGESGNKLGLPGVCE